jgi:hypothetical protein
MNVVTRLREYAGRSTTYRAKGAPSLGAPRGARMPVGESPTQLIAIQLKENEDISTVMDEV